MNTQEFLQTLYAGAPTSWMPTDGEALTAGGMLTGGEMLSADEAPTVGGSGPSGGAPTFGGTGPSGGAPTLGWLTVWTLPDKKTAYFPVSDLAKAAAYAARLGDTHDVYYGVGLRGQKLGPRQRGSSDDVSVIPAFWSDIDVRGSAHKETALPATVAEALGFLDSLPLKPSIVVSSGNGLHVYWLLDKPLEIMDKAQRKSVAEALRGWQLYINTAAKKNGWKLDNTSDLSRVLRLPGSINHKKGGSGERVAVVMVHDERYAPADFSDYTAPKPKTNAPMAALPVDQKQHFAAVQSSSGGLPSGGQPSAEGTTSFSGTVGSGERILEKCAFLRHCRDNAATLPEPQWYAMLGNLALCSDGAALCHQFSKGYPGYSYAETEKKIAHAQQAKKPHTCAYIRDVLGFECDAGSPDGQCQAAGSSGPTGGSGRAEWSDPTGRSGTRCKAPIALAIITKAETVRNLLETEIDDYTVLFDTEYLDALCYAKANMPGDYAKFKMKLKGKVNLVDLEKCIKAYGEKFKKTTDDAADLMLDGIDLRGAVIPRKWQITAKGGVRRAFSSKDAEGEVIACPDPVVVTRRLVNIDDGKERLELNFRRDGRWKSIVGGRTQIYNKASIIGFGDEGLHVTSGTAGELVNYLSDYETANKNVIPRVSSISRLGWIDAGSPCGSGQFFPYSVNEEILFEEDKGTATLYRSLAEHGDYAVWKTMMKTLRVNPVARFLTSAAFAAPLLCKIGVRTFVIHLWHMSASGKSAALKAAISVWGNPLRIMGNGFTTVVGTEQLAGTLRHLPFGIDEKQSADERRLSLEHLIYVLGQGSGKIRGAKGGGNAEVATWHNIVMLTGEEPVTRSSSLDGIQTRTFELYGKPIEDMEFAKDVHIISENNYGFAGAQFMRCVCSMLRENKDALRREYQRISNKIKEKGLRNIHADYVSAVALGDYLAETLIFGTDSETALCEALACGEAVYALNDAQMSSDVVERAWDFITGWLVSNEHRFSSDATPFYGKSEFDPGEQYTEYLVIPQYLDDALEEAGFNVKKTFQGLRERGYITTQKDSAGKDRTKHSGWVYGKTVRGYLLRVQTSHAQPYKGRY